jgi:hypothetical protein
MLNLMSHTATLDNQLQSPNSFAMKTHFLDSSQLTIPQVFNFIAETTYVN